MLAQLVKNLPAMQETRFNSWVGKIPWRRDRLSTPVFLGFPGGSAGKEPPAMQETWVQSLAWEDPLEKGTATHYWPGNRTAKSWTRLSDFHFLFKKLYVEDL